MGGKAIGVLLLPVLTRLLTPDQYGRFDLLSTLGSAGISIALLGMNVPATRIAVDPVRASDRGRVMGSWLAIQLAALVPPCVVLVAAAPAISDVLFGAATLAQAVQAVGLILVAGTIHYVTLTILRIQQRPIAFTVLSAGTLAVNAVLAVVLLVLWTADERAPLVAYGVSLTIGTTLGLVAVGRSWFGRPDVRTASSLVFLGLPLVPAIAATWFAEFFNRSVLLSAAGATELGYFSVAIRFASLAALMVVGFQLAWQPRAFSLGTSPEALVLIARDGHRILVTVSAGVVLTAAAAPELIQIVSGSSFGPALGPLGLSLVGVLATAAYLVTSMPSALATRFRDLGLAGAIGVVVGVALNVLLAPRLGASGTALAVSVGQIVAAAGVWLLGRRAVTLPLPVVRTLTIISLAASAALVSTTAPGGAPVLVRAALVGLFAVAVWWDGSVTSLGAILTSWRRRRW